MEEYGDYQAGYQNVSCLEELNLYVAQTDSNVQLRVEPLKNYWTVMHMRNGI